MKTVSGAASEVVRFSVQNASFQARMKFKQQRRGDARHRHGREHVDQFLAHRGAVHAGGLKDVLGDLLEVGEQHPHHDRQVAEAQHEDEPGAGVEQAEVAEDQVDRHEHADRRQHLGGEHPQEHVLGALGRREGHRPGRRHGDEQRDQRRAAGDDQRVHRMGDVVAALLHGGVVLRRPMEEQEGRRGGEGLQLGLEAGQHHPEDGEEDEEADRPGGERGDEDAGGGIAACHDQTSRLRPTMRIRKMARMLAMTTATRPPAEAPPTSYWMSACE